MAVPYARLEKLVAEGTVHRSHKGVLEVLLKRKLINETHLGDRVSGIIDTVLGTKAELGVVDVSKLREHELKLLASEIKLAGTSH